MNKTVDNYLSVLKKHFFSIIFIFLTVSCQSQTPQQLALKVKIDETNKFKIVNASKNNIENAKSLDSFFKSLVQLKKHSTEALQVNICHIGDSHIQADFMTRIVREKLQLEFGNAGRGLIFPYKASGTNEPFDLHSETNVKWEMKRCVYPEQPLPIGVSGITMNTSDASAFLKIKTINSGEIDNSFNQVKLFSQPDREAFNLKMNDLQIENDNALENEPKYSKTVKINATNEMMIQNMAEGNKKFTRLYGIQLMNSKNGILYNMIGVNGAKYKDYNAAIYFIPQLNELGLTNDNSPKIDLIIVSMGTNEANDNNFSTTDFENQIDELMKKLMPLCDSKIILTTPVQTIAFKNQSPKFELIQKTISNYAIKNNLAYWDLYAVCNGPAAALKFNKAGLQRQDGVHFTKEGYEYLGNLFYQAIIKAYNQYVSTRHS